MEYQIIMFVVFFELSKVILGRILMTDENVMHYTNYWVIQVSKNNKNVLERLEIHGGFEISEVEHLMPDFHILIHRRHPGKAKYENKNLTNSLVKYEEILWAEQISMKRIEVKFIRCPGKWSLRASSNYKGIMNDKLFNKQWYMQDCRKVENHARLDINVLPVWHKYGFFGRGIKVMVVDGGIQTNHPDLQANYDPYYGYDFVENDTTPDAKPFLKFFRNPHGTRCAGIIAMQANNNICGVGIAPLVTLGALRIFSYSKTATSLNTARALMFKAEEVDVSSNSWGPDDGGKKLEITNRLQLAAMKEGIITGRRAKGIIYVFAAGNGRHLGDTCAHDHLANLMFTITVAGVNHTGEPTIYSERCSNILVASYSGDGNYGLWGNIVSTNLYSFCTTRFRGTSAAVPMVAAVAALIIEANPELTWREIQHVFAWTSEVAALSHNRSWNRNKAGFFVSQDFGFGLIDAFNAVTFARTMKPISPMNSCVHSFKFK